MKPFCYWHIATKENPEGTDCAAHLHEARCFKCHYNLDNIQYNQDTERLYISSTSSDLIGACQDFKLNDELEKKLENVPNDKKLETLKSILNS